MDTETRLQALEDKIHSQDQKLHRQDKKLRLHKRLGLIAMALLVGVAAFAATKPVPDSIEANRIRAEYIVAKNFYLRDDAGKVRGAFGITPKGVYFKMMGGKNRKRELLLAISNKGSAMNIMDSQGVLRMEVGLPFDEKTGEESPLINFRDKKGKLRMGMGTHDNSVAAIFFLDSAERARVIMGADDEEPVFSFRDKAGETRVDMEYLKDGYHELKFFNEKGIPYWPGSSILK